MSTVLAAILGALTLVITESIVGLIVRPTDIVAPPGAGPWWMASQLLLAGTLAVLARRARLAGPTLAAALFIIAAVLGPISAFVEGVFFDIFGSTSVWRLFVMGTVPLVTGAIVIPAAAGLWRKPARPAPAPSSPSTGRLLGLGAIASIVYVVCYITAGTIIFPWVRAFYATRPLPSPGTLLALQLLVRGPMFVAVVALIGRMLPGSRALHAFAGGAVMTIVGGVVPLMVPNMFLPDAVRWVHFGEVCVSNFVFGAVAGWLMSPARAILPAERGSVAAPLKEIAHERVR